MKKLFVIIIIVSFFLTINAQSKLSDKEVDGLKGNVKSVAKSYTYFKEKNGKRIKTRNDVTHEKHYDKNGNTILALNHTTGEKEIYSIIDGDKTFKATKIKRIGSSPVISTKPLQNSKSEPLDKRYTIKFKYEYDDNNRVVKEYTFGNNDRLVNKIFYKYDEKGRIEEIEKYDNYQVDKVVTRASLKYDENDNIVEETTILLEFGGYVSKRLYSEYKFDAQGNWINRTRTTIDNNGKPGKEFDHRKIEYYLD